MKKIIPLILLLIHFTSLSAKHPRYLSACCIFQNEARFLKEWIDYHKLVGVEYFYLYNHQSQDHYLEVLAPYIESGEVELVDVNKSWSNIVEWNGIQCQAYQDAINKASHNTTWMIILDSDEFFVPVIRNTLPKILKHYEKYAGVCPNWQVYGTSNVEKIPRDQLLIETLTKKGPTKHPKNLHVKSIVQPDKVERIDNPHYVYYKPGFFQVTPRKHRFEGPFSPHIDVSILRINHYWTRDLEFFRTVKMQRYQGWNGLSPSELEESEKEFNLKYDFIMEPFVKSLKGA